MRTPTDALGTAATPEQREALASPLRLEIFGYFASVDRLSVRELADRMGRSASSLYYHLHRMVDAGLLREAGERSRGPRTETLYERVGPGAKRLTSDGSPEARDAILRTMAAGFRMAERDLEAALEAGFAEGGSDLPTATRLHFRASRPQLEELRGHLRSALEVIARTAEEAPRASEPGSHYSLTLALLPLHGRESERS
jgi:DNA-binding transcriptional ArsR family regulator